jgi:predicted  nucleic acid-binding Zn-ribbon protein
MMEGVGKFIKAHALSLIVIAAGFYGAWVLIQRRVDDLEKKMIVVEAKLQNVASSQEIVNLRESLQDLAKKNAALEQAISSIKESTSRIESTVNNLTTFLLNRRSRTSGD